MWPEMARRNKNDPAKTHAAACFSPNTRNSQMPAAHRDPMARDRVRSVDNRRLCEVSMIAALKQYYETEWRINHPSDDLGIAGTLAAHRVVGTSLAFLKPTLSMLDISARNSSSFLTGMTSGLLGKKNIQFPIHRIFTFL